MGHADEVRLLRSRDIGGSSCLPEKKGFRPLPARLTADQGEEFFPNLAIGEATTDG